MFVYIFVDKEDILALGFGQDVNFRSRPQGCEDIVGGDRKIERSDAHFNIVKAGSDLELPDDTVGKRPMVVQNSLWVSGRAGGIDRDRRVLHIDLGEFREDLFVLYPLEEFRVNGKVRAAVLYDKRDPILGVLGRKRRISRSRA